MAGWLVGWQVGSLVLLFCIVGIHRSREKGHLPVARYTLSAAGRGRGRGPYLMQTRQDKTRQPENLHIGGGGLWQVYSVLYLCLYLSSPTPTYLGIGS